MARIFLASCALMFLAVGSARADDVDSLLARIKAVGREGAGNVDAAKARKELVAKGPGVLPSVLAALDDASPTAGNWLRSAVESIRDDALSQKKPLPADKLEAFVKDTRHAGHARRLAYDLLLSVDPNAADRLLPGMHNDPGAELRRDAVAVLLKDASKLTDKGEQTKLAYKKIFDAARDHDQVNAAADKLKTLGVDVDLTSHFGFVIQWLVVGPFDNTKGVGFSNVYPPDKGVDVKAVYVGKDKKELRWQPHTTAEKLGLVDFNKIFGPLKGTVGYAYTVVTSPVERPIELRAASNNAIRVSLNGKEVYFREEYHHGMEIDQHVGRGVLKAGRNEILVKVCQNEQTDSWAAKWSFQLRIADALGGAVPVVVVTEKIAPAGGGE